MTTRRKGLEAMGVTVGGDGVDGNGVAAGLGTPAGVGLGLGSWPVASPATVRRPGG